MWNYIALSVLAAYFYLPPLTPNPATFSLEEALQQKIVRVNWENNSKGTHYMQPLLLNIKNLRSIPCTITLANGWLLTPTDSIYQTLVTTQALAMELKANEQQNYLIQAMCTEPHDRAPYNAMRYQLYKKSSEGMQRLTNLIEQRKYYNSQAQNAVWVLAAGNPLAAVNGFQVACRDSLLDMLCMITKQPRPKPSELEDYRYNPRSTAMKVAVSGRINFELRQNAAIHMGLFNKNQVQVRALYYEASAKVGNHSIYYAFDNAVYTDSTYFVKTIINEKVLFNRKFEMKRG